MAASASREWAGATETGDRAEIDDLPDDLPLWSELTATSEQCLGPRVPAATATASSRACASAPPTADVVIVNHHLLCADASVRQGGFGEVIPECDLAVIDEAHQLEDVVTQYFGVSVSTYRVDEFVARRASAALSAAPDTRESRSVRDARVADREPASDVGQAAAAAVRSRAPRAAAASRPRTTA